MNPFKVRYYSTADLVNFGFKSIGNNVQIAGNCMINGIENISIDSNVRIDGYSSLIVTGGGFLKIGSYVHIGSYCHLLANDGITIGDFSGLSQGVRIYTRNDDYSGETLTNPTVPEKFRGVSGGSVTLKDHVILGSGSIVLPNIYIGEGTAVGALSLVHKNLEPWTVYFGNPVRKFKKRSKKLLEYRAKILGASF